MTLIPATLAARQGKLWAELRTSGHSMAWLEFDPVDGRNSLCVREWPGTTARRLTPAPWSVRSRVHEYGGGAYCWVGRWLVFVNDADQGLYWQCADEPQTPMRLWYKPGHRYGDLRFDPVRQRLLMIEEIHTGERIENRLVALPLRRAGLAADGPLQVIASGADFYSSPCLSPGGEYLAWLSWNHPFQPWRATALTLASLDTAGLVEDALELVSLQQGISVFQPGFDQSGNLCFVADRPPRDCDPLQAQAGWWNLYRYRFETGREGDPVPRLYAGQVQALCPMKREFGVAQWQLGLRCWCLLPGNRLLASWFDQGQAGLIELDLQAERRIPRVAGLARCHSLQMLDGVGAVLLTEQADDYSCLQLLTDASPIRTIERLSAHSRIEVATPPQPFFCATADGSPVWGFYYRPHQGVGPAPLLIQIHGGPTSMADCSYDPMREYWLSRGFAMLVLNYRGSSGFGREYRMQLHERWGITDCEDVLFAARHAVEQGWADPRRIFVRGNSAGGYTVLRVLSGAGPMANVPSIRAGASHYGISDLQLLNRHTHKFESRYLSWLIGDESLEYRYHERSPIHYADHNWKPVLFFQGDQDQVVPAEQTLLLHAALQERGRISEVRIFEGEGHGFRQARHRQQLLEQELAFYRQFGA